MGLAPRWIFYIGLVAVAFTGCQNQDTRNLPATVKAAGYVTLDGQPVVGAAVVFLPEDPNGYPAQGFTNSSGYFELQAFEKKQGAVPGRYKIQVSKTVEMKGGQEAAASTPPTAAEESEHTAEDSRGVFYRNVLPQKYASIATSGLAAEIPPEGVSDLKIELKSTP